MPLQSPLLASVPGLRHAFGDRAEPIDRRAFADWDARRPLWKQVHGTAVAVPAGPGAECGEADALVSFTPGAPIAVVTADCVPVLLARRDGGAAAAVHAGWRGTRARILAAVAAELRGRSEEPANWVAAVGPAIGPCCYEVSEELAADFAREFGPPAVPRHRHLDLPAINAEALRSLGFGAVELLRACTRCATSADGSPAYHSYRREGGGTRQFSMIAAAAADLSAATAPRSG